MRDVTDILMLYGEAVRHLWNTYFFGEVHSLRDCGALDRFEQIDQLMFAAIVLDRLGVSQPTGSFRSKELPFFHVVPRGKLDKLPMMISDPIVNGNRAWNERVFVNLDPDTKLAFIEFFDWEQIGYISFPLIRAKILHFPSRPDLVSREALIESHRCSILLEALKP